MKLLILSVIIIYLFIAYMYFRELCYEDGEYTLKSFYYALFLPITLIYKYFNEGCLE